MQHPCAYYIFFHNTHVLCPSPRTVEDFDDWTNWLLYKGGVGVKGDHSWESWWDEEQVSSNLPVFQLLFYFNLGGLFLSLKLTVFNYLSLKMYIQEHIQTLRGRILETILSLRFLIFQYGIVYKLKITHHNTTLAVSCAISSLLTIIKIIIVIFIYHTYILFSHLISSMLRIGSRIGHYFSSIIN